MKFLDRYATPKAIEVRVRRIAARRELVITKSRRRDKFAPDYGRITLKTMTGTTLATFKDSETVWSEISDYLREGRYK